jgi:hypothetical protein
MKIIFQTTIRIFLIATLAVVLNSKPYCIYGLFNGPDIFCIACGEGYASIDGTCTSLPDGFFIDNCLEYIRTEVSGIICVKIKEGYREHNNQIVPNEIQGCAIEVSKNGIAYCQACFDGKEFIGDPLSCQEPNDLDKIKNCLIVSISHDTEIFLNNEALQNEGIKKQLKRKCRLCKDGYSIYKQEFVPEDSSLRAERCKTGPPNCFELRDGNPETCLKCKYGFRMTEEFKCVNVEGAAQLELI